MTLNLTMPEGWKDYEEYDYDYEGYYDDYYEDIELSYDYNFAPEDKGKSEWKDNYFCGEMVDDPFSTAIATIDSE